METNTRALLVKGSSVRPDMASKTGIWLSRIVIVFVSFIFTMISLRYLLHPVESAAEIGISLTTPTAITVARVGMGGFPVSMAVLFMMNLFSNKRLFTGVVMIFILVTIITAIRIQGIMIDGATPYNVNLLRPEFVIIIASGAAVLLERRRKRRYNEA